MKPPLPVLAALACLATASAHNGPHGAANDTEKFHNADVDSSGGLARSEFRTTFSTLVPQRQIDRAFQKADASRDGSLSLAEWLAYRATTFEGRETLVFNNADSDGDGGLTLDEFAATQTGRKPFIRTRAAFIASDHDLDGHLSLAEWLLFRGKKSRHNHGAAPSTFALADMDGGDSLTPDEFAHVFPPNAKPEAVLKKFNQLDRNDDGLLTRNEWNPGRRGAL
jgi:Ca2+-binding EF-hand superfamily protein